MEGTQYKVPVQDYAPKNQAALVMAVPDQNSQPEDQLASPQESQPIAPQPDAQPSPQLAPQPPQPDQQPTPPSNWQTFMVVTILVVCCVFFTYLTVCIVQKRDDVSFGLYCGAGALIVALLGTAVFIENRKLKWVLFGTCAVLVLVLLAFISVYLSERGDNKDAKETGNDSKSSS